MTLYLTISTLTALFVLAQGIEFPAAFVIGVAWPLSPLLAVAWWHDRGRVTGI